MLEDMSGKERDQVRNRLLPEQRGRVHEKVSEKPVKMHTSRASPKDEVRGHN
ncbi:hypothetical protein JRQ81_002951 [Phrynocephalus forsythii]|uniref:Uncharacterized protein n=1 Tax=Phrynocephalus forsythii TaxID=171643 RepID=A0A9Q0XIU3_9SAUR|nr:hypothetical protein JRQ81_002951 [Phrynocephalus forsythii]